MERRWRGIEFLLLWPSCFTIPGSRESKKLLVPFFLGAVAAKIYLLLGRATRSLNPCISVPWENEWK